MSIRRTLLTAILAFSSFFMSGRGMNMCVQYEQEPDSVLIKSLDSKLDEYFSVLETESIDVKIQECDFLINSVSDSLLKQHVGLYLYDHFLKSQLMGDEAVCVYLVDKWFAPGKLKMTNDIDLLNAQIFAQFNRASLIGNKAPILKMKTFDGGEMTFPSAGRLSVLLFYDVTCSNCIYESMKLRQELENADYPLNIFAIYVGADHDAWERFIDSRWNYSTGASVYHLWDPEIDSNFQMEYGVIQTPQMLLVDSDGVIVGRKLTTDALFTLLDSYFPKPYRYGVSSSISFFEELCRDNTAEQILDVAEYVKTQAMASGDSTLCKHLLGDFFYYLLDSRGEEVKQALAVFIDRYIDGQPDLWDAEEDEKQVLAPAHIAKDLLSRAKIGSRIPKLKVKAILKTKSEQGVELSQLAVKTYKLHRLHADQTFIVFHTDGCGACEDVSRVADSMFDDHSDIQFLFVEPTADMLDLFDLSVLPHIIQIDRKGIIKRKYISISSD